MKDCRRAARWVEREHEGELALERRLALDAHLALCAPCRARAARARRLDEALARLPEPPLERLDVARRAAAIRAQLERDARPDEREAHRPLRRMANAAALVLALVLGALAWRVADDEERVEPPAPPAAAVARDEASAPAPAPAPTPLDPIDTQRLNDARDRAAAALVEHVAPLARAERDALEPALARFETAAAPLARDGWDLRQLALALLERDDPAVASAAARDRGLRGGRHALARLERALERESVAQSALLALADRGAEGADGLARALRDPSLAGAARARLVALGGSSAARAFADAYAATSDADLLAALASLGDQGALSLVRLRASGALAAGELARACAEAPSLDEPLVRLFTQRLTPSERDALLEAVAARRPPDALAWIETLCRERPTRAAALDALASYEDVESLRVATRLFASDVASDDELAPRVARMVAAGPDRIVAYARELIDAGDGVRAEGLLELLVVAGRSAAVPALCLLAGSRVLDEQSARWAALAASELGEPSHAALLTGFLARFEHDDARVAAAHVIAIDRLAGEERALAALDPPDARSAERVRALLAAARRKPSSTSSTVFALARELERQLDVTASRRSTP